MRILQILTKKRRLCNLFVLSIWSNKIEEERKHVCIRNHCAILIEMNKQKNKSYYQLIERFEKCEIEGITKKMTANTMIWISNANHIYCWGANHLKKHKRSNNARFNLSLNRKWLVSFFPFLPCFFFFSFAQYEIIHIFNTFRND